MPVVAVFAGVVIFMGVIVALSMRGDRSRRANSPPPVPRPVPPNLPTGVHLRWGVKPLPPSRSDELDIANHLLKSGDEFFVARPHQHREAVRELREILDGIPPPTSRARFQFALAQSLLELGSYAEADDVLRDGLASLDPSDAVFRGDLVGKQGEVAWAYSELDRARMLLETAAKMPRRLTGDAWIELHLGLVERDAGALDPARNLLSSALASFDVEHTASTAALVHVLLASVDLRAGRLHDAYAHLEQAAVSAPEDVFLRPYGETVASAIARERGDLANAVSLSTAARAALERLDLPPYVAEADLELARAHAARADSSDAKACYWRALWAFDSFGCTAKVERVRSEMAALGP